jgi:hypothetical protein
VRNETTAPSNGKFDCLGQHSIFHLTNPVLNEAVWGSGVIAPSVLDLSTRWREVVSPKLRPLYPQEMAPCTYLIEGWVRLRACNVKNCNNFVSTKQADYRWTGMTVTVISIQTVRQPHTKIYRCPAIKLELCHLGNGAKRQQLNLAKINCWTPISDTSCTMLSWIQWNSELKHCYRARKCCTLQAAV